MKKIFLIAAIIIIAPAFVHFSGCSSTSGEIALEHNPNNETGLSDNEIPLATDSNNSGTETTDSGSTGSNTTGDSSTDPINNTDTSATEPYIFDEFDDGGSLWKFATNTTSGAVTFSFNDPNANDGKAAKILFGGNPTLGPADKTGPSNSKKINLIEKLGYGVYKFRVKPATCSASDEEMITGIFTYANNGSDANSNGITDNNEIDIEFACSLPSTFWLTVWTDYQYKNGIKYAVKKTRRIRFIDGTYKDSVQTGDKSTITEVRGDLPAALKDTSFDSRAQYLTLGFEWRAEFVRFFIEKNSEEIDLWKMTDASFVPTPPADFIVNLWHASTIWSSPESAAADYPKNDVTLLVDYFKYWK